MPAWGSLQPLSTEFYTLLRYGLFLVLFFHLPVVGVLIGGSAVSLGLSVVGKEKREPAYLRLSREVMNTVWAGKAALLIFGIVPLLMFWVIYARIFFDASPLPWPFWSVLLALLIAGFALLSRYRTARERSTDLSAVQLGSGATGLLAVLFAFFLFSGGYGILFNPEKLPLLRMQLRFFLSWNAFVKYFLFLAFFFGMTGGLVLRFMGQAPQGKGDPEDGYRAFVRDFGAALALYATLALPLFLLLDLVTLPQIALSAGVFATVAILLLLSLAGCLAVARCRGREGAGAGAAVSVPYVLIFLALLVHDHVAVGNAYRDRIAFLAMEAPAAAAEHAGEAPPQVPAATAKKAEEAGKAVFGKRCSGCHRFDVRVVGPPLNQRVPKYRGDVEKLKAFIRKPVKVSPDYPSMPNLGLSEEEIDAVARYLIGAVPGGGAP